MRKKFFPVRVVRPWPRLPREAVAAPSLAVSKARLDGALNTLVWWKWSLLMAGGWSDMICKFPPNPSHSVILCFYEIQTAFPCEDHRDFSCKILAPRF